MNLGMGAATAVSEMDGAIKATCINYMELMLDCGKDRHKRDNFLENPRPFLDYAGMDIPEEVPILLEVGLNFPTLYISAGEGKVRSYEGKRSIKAIRELRNPEGDSGEARMKEISEIEPEAAAKLGEPGVDAVVVMPFFDLYSDMLGAVKFQDGAEIILSSC